MNFNATGMWVFAALTLAATIPTQGQAGPPPSQQTPSFRAQSTLVLVPTLVRDHAGKPVFTLTANDFTVTDNGVEQKVSLEDDTDSQPLALVVAVETGGGGARQLENYGNLPTLVESLVGNVQHQVAVIDFDSESRLDQDFTSDWVPVAGALQSLRPGNDGAAILDAVSYSVDLLRQQPPQYRRAILLLKIGRAHV